MCVVVAAGLLAGAAGCAPPANPPLPTATPSPVATASPAPTPVRPSVPPPTDFRTVIDHPFSPMRPGTRWVYEEAGPDGVDRIVVTVTDRTRTVGGIRAVVVHDRVTGAGGELLEDTEDWYAQDRAGNVWYLGEDTTAYEGKKTSKAGSWEHGVGGAVAGLAMPAEPAVGTAYYQEYAPGEAEDQARVLALDAEAEVPYGRFTGLVKTADFTALEPDLLEHKYYARGVGLVYAETVAGGQERLRLLSVSWP